MQRKLTVRWLIPFPIAASGGHRTIYAHMERMVADGYNCIACVDLRQISSPLSSRRTRLRELQTLLAKKDIGVEFGHEAITKDADIAVATSWQTAFDVASCAAPYKAYFIQDYEPWFFPHGDQYLKAEHSYRLGLTPIVLGRWLANKIGGLSHQTPFVLPFAIDSHIYTRTASSKRSKAICYLHQPEKPRRCAALAQAALLIVRAQRPDIEIWSYGSKRVPDLDTKHFGVLTHDACADLYNKAAVGLCISASNPSRIPFEMAACGLPVVDIDAENTRADALSPAFLLTPADPVSLARTMIRAVDEGLSGKLDLPPTIESFAEGEASDELGASALAFRQMLEAPPNATVPQTEARIEMASSAWLRLRRRLIKAYIAFFEHS